ncbi:MAG: ABC transporter permease [FCB group bacterium]|nr:ABC transporter permease [FCB group bacterium]
MSWRNVWRYRRRTIITVAAMTLALWVMILYTGLVEGYILGMERNVLDLEIGDIQVFAGDYRDNPSIYTRIRKPEELLLRLDEKGYRACSRLLGGGLVAAGEASAGASFRGLDINHDKDVNLIHKHVAQGDWLAADQPKGVVIGRRLARILDVGPGDELIGLSQAADGSIANELYTVRGVLKGISEATDRMGVFMTAEAFREFFVFSEGAHQIIIRRPEYLELNTVVDDVRALMPELDVKTWRELLPTIASMVDSMQGLMIIIFFIVYIAIGILILNAMLMAVFERIREIGVLKALGVGPGQLFFLIIAESSIQTGLAVLVGLMLSVPGLWYLLEVGINMGSLSGMSIMGLAVDPVWRAEVNVNTFTKPVLTLVVIVFAAVIYPALKAAWIQPIRAMRHQ